MDTKHQSGISRKTKPGGVHRHKLAELTQVLNKEATRGEAAKLLRGLLSEIRLVPDGDSLAIELAGELAAIMALGDADSNTPRRDVAGAFAGTMVAGTGKRLYRIVISTS